jgi:hypothetical protein
MFGAAGPPSLNLFAMLRLWYQELGLTMFDVKRLPAHLAGEFEVYLQLMQRERSRSASQKG